MLNIKLREDLCKFAWDTVNKRNFGNRSAGANGSKEQQYTGILGETVIYDIVYGKLPEYNETGTVDIVINGKKIDIKTLCQIVPDIAPHFASVLGIKGVMPSSKSLKEIVQSIQDSDKVNASVRNKMIESVVANAMGQEIASQKVQDTRSQVDKLTAQEACFGRPGVGIIK